MGTRRPRRRTRGTRSTGTTIAADAARTAVADRSTIAARTARPAGGPRGARTEPRPARAAVTAGDDLRAVGT